MPDDMGHQVPLGVLKKEPPETAFSGLPEATEPGGRHRALRVGRRLQKSMKPKLKPPVRPPSSVHTASLNASLIRDLAKQTRSKMIAAILKKE